MNSHLGFSEFNVLRIFEQGEKRKQFRLSAIVPNNRKHYGKVTTLKSKLSLILGQLNRALNDPAQKLAKSICSFI